MRSSCKDTQQQTQTCKFTSIHCNASWLNSAYSAEVIAIELYIIAIDSSNYSRLQDAVQAGFATMALANSEQPSPYSTVSCLPQQAAMEQGDSPAESNRVWAESPTTHACHVPAGKPKITYVVTYIKSRVDAHTVSRIVN